jgi:hypothetical protein
VVLHLTEWQEYQDLDPASLKTVVDAPVVIDGRNKLDHDRWRGAGWTYRALGRLSLNSRSMRAGAAPNRKNRTSPDGWAENAQERSY